VKSPERNEFGRDSIHRKDRTPLKRLRYAPFSMETLKRSAISGEFGELS